MSASKISFFESYDLDIDKIINRLNLFKKYSDTDLLDLFNRGREEFIPSQTKYTESSNERFRFLCIGLALNERGILAPAFRGYPRNTYSEEYDDLSQIYACDKQLIDLHWLATQRLISRDTKRSSIDGYFLLDKGGFNFKGALKIAAMKLKASTKVRRLKISKDEQLMLSMLRTTAIENKRNRAIKKLNEIELNLVDVANKPRSRFDKTKTSLRAQEWLCLRLSDSSPTKAADNWRSLNSEPSAHSEDTSKVALHKRFRDRKTWFEEQRLL